MEKFTKELRMEVSEIQEDVGKMRNEQETKVNEIEQKNELSLIELKQEIKDHKMNKEIKEIEQINKKLKEVITNPES